MRSMKSFMLGAALAVGVLGLGATAAHAAELGVYIGGPVAYVPPCPGAGYAWVAGYSANGYWVPGRWNYVGVGDRDRFARFDRDGDRYQHFYTERDRGRDFDRRQDRGGDRFRR